MKFNRYKELEPRGDLTFPGPPSRHETAGQNQSTVTNSDLLSLFITINTPESSGGENAPHFRWTGRILAAVHGTHDQRIKPKKSENLMEITIQLLSHGHLI